MAKLRQKKNAECFPCVQRWEKDWLITTILGSSWWKALASGFKEAFKEVITVKENNAGIIEEEYYDSIKRLCAQKGEFIYGTLPIMTGLFIRIFPIYFYFIKESFY